MPALHLIPEPRTTHWRGTKFTLPSKLFIILPKGSGNGCVRDLFAAEHFATEMEPLAHVHCHVVTGAGVAADQEIRIVTDPATGAKAPEAVREQAYRLSITPKGITIAAGGGAGVFYAFQTLLQIVRETAFTAMHNLKRRTNRPPAANRKSQIENQKPLVLPCVEIEDWPDFPRRGVYHDTARGKVPTVDTLLQLIDDLAHLKYNEFQLYVENAFEFRRHPEMYEDTNPLTAEELLLLDAACRERHMEFVPSLTSLGHFEKILSRPKFRHLAEAEPAQLKAMNAPCWVDAPWSLCVTDPDARQFLKDMYEEFVPNFSSPHFNICCDEAYDLGAVRSKQAAEKRGGVGQLYVDWIDYCNTLAKSHGKSIQMWGDIILNHPDLIAQLPPDAALLEWGYEHDHKFDEHCAVFAERLKSHGSSGESCRTFYVCPGTSSWLTLSARTKNAFGNIRNAAAAGLKHGAAGMLVTDWGDNGHQQMLAVSLAPMAYGAAAGWNLAATPAVETVKRKSRLPKQSSSNAGPLAQLLTAISLHLFQDPSGTFASLAYDLGLTYERFSWQRFNASVDWFLFREKWDFANYVNRAEPQDLPNVIKACEALIPLFADTRMLHPHANLLQAEMVFTCEEIIHTCRRTALRQAWLAAAPATRNPEHEALRGKRPVPLHKTFKAEMKRLAADAKKLSADFSDLWLARNKPSRLQDIVAEFDRLQKEYRRFGR